MALIINSLKSHGMISVSTKDQPSVSFSPRMEGYSEDILLKIGKRKRNKLFATLQMIKLGFFLLRNNANSELNKHLKIKR